MYRLNEQEKRRDHLHYNKLVLDFSSSEKHNIASVAKEKLNSFVMGHMNQYFKLVKKRIELEVRGFDVMSILSTL